MMLISYLLYGLFSPILKMNRIKNAVSKLQYLSVKGHLKSCSLNQNQPAGDAIETTRHSFFDNEKFWT